jgi:CDP-glucose 4,6-dehydratase
MNQAQAEGRFSTRQAPAFDLKAWQGRRVFVTGHQGFKGAWLSYLLQSLQCQIFGYGIDRRERLLSRTLSLANLQSEENDILDLDALTKSMQNCGAEVIFHLAAQPLVRASYADPIGTIQTNVVGTANVLEAARRSPAVRAVVIITSDKVYQPSSNHVMHVEDDNLGGRDLYSASKAAAEIITTAMTLSFFKNEGRVHVATARAGNVIGGGDWASARLLPDAIRAFEAAETLKVRSPEAVRPWQHVLEPLHGYLRLAQALLDGDIGSPSSFNFGPSPQDILTVREVLDVFCAAWADHPGWTVERDDQNLAESGHLSISSDLANDTLGWRPTWSAELAIARTAEFYRRLVAGEDGNRLMANDLERFRDDQIAQSQHEEIT